MFNINIDISELDDLLDVDGRLKKEAADAGKDLTAMIKAKASEIAAQKLHSRLKMYNQGLFIEQVDDNTWFVGLRKNVRWIDDGQPAWEMLPYLMGSKKAKRAKDGSRYVVIPFNKGAGTGGKATSTPAQQDLVASVKKELKSRGIPFGKHEKDAQGNDRMGRLHTFSIDNAPVKKDPGAGQRRGPVGEVMQGNSGTPFLQGVAVYQSKGKNGKTQRSILTFRIASERHSSEAKWEHPGNAPTNILEQAADEAASMWVKEIAPALIDDALANKG